MPLSLALVFHFNQHTSEFAAVADRACYRGLLTVLRAHPQLKFNLHFSGTLLRALNWLAPETLDLVRAGLADGQFELLGSTYAQNVPYACDDWDNAQQLGLHRAVLQELFGVAPVAFWNPERCWRQSLVPVIAQAGYRVTLVEDHLLRAGGLDGLAPAETRVGAHALTLVYDDPILRERFNFAAWFGRRAQLFNYLDALGARPGADQALVAYAEDAEAMGLWPWEAGCLPQAAWSYLDKLLDEFEQRGLAPLTHLATVQPRQAVDHLPDGAARWMDLALNRPEAPYHEDGFTDWFDFLHRSPKVQYFRKLYAVVRSNLQQVGAARRDPGYPRPAATAADRFYRQAIETYCSHQYEFGCIGVGGRGYWGWENVRAAFLYTRLAEIAEDPQPRQWIEDLNGDGSDEQLLCDGEQLVVLTAYGGRLLGWFDLRAGRQWVGNPLAVPRAAYVSGASEHPRLTPLPARWLPDSPAADLRPWREHKTKQAGLGRLSRHFTPELFAREADDLVVYRVPPAPASPAPARAARPRSDEGAAGEKVGQGAASPPAGPGERADGARPPLPAQTGALNDWLAVDDEAPRPPDSFLDYRFEVDGVVSYLNALMPDLRLDKRIRLMPAGLHVQYVVQNLADRPRRLRWRLAHELAPDYVAALSGGRSVLALDPPALPAAAAPAGGEPGAGRLTMRNTRSGIALTLAPSRPWTEHGLAEHLLGLELWLALALDLKPLSVETMDLTLSVTAPG